MERLDYKINDILNQIWNSPSQKMFFTEIKAFDEYDKKDEISEIMMQQGIINRNQDLLILNKFSNDIQRQGGWIKYLLSENENRSLKKWNNALTLLSLMMTILSTILGWLLLTK